MMLNVACGLLATYLFTKEGAIGQTAFAGFVYVCAYILRFHFFVLESSRYKFEI